MYLLPLTILRLHII